MTDEIRKQIDGLNIKKIGNGWILNQVPQFDEYLLKSDVIELIEKMTKWNKVEDDGYPEIGVLVQTKNINDFTGEVYYDHDRVIVDPETGEKMFDSDQMIGSIVTEWKSIT